MKSSGIQFVFWMVLLVYEVIRLRSMSLIHQDDLVIWGWVSTVQVMQVMQTYVYHLVFLIGSTKMTWYVLVGRGGAGQHKTIS